jgi:hypothetical protein
MAVNPEFVKRLIEELAEITNESLDNRGFEVMSNYIEEKADILITKRYLYETYSSVYQSSKDGVKEVRVFADKMDTISKVLGYKNFNGFMQIALKPIDPLLKGCIGKWWSIVRANNGAYLLKAPVKIFLNENQTEILIELQGGQRSFSGNVSLRAGNIFCELDTGKDKKLYVVMKVGTSEHPLLLQGTFAGISSAGDPIAGRELFVREEKLSFEEMKWEKLPVGENNLDVRINDYFGKYEGNCLKIGLVSTFSKSDLDNLNH